MNAVPLQRTSITGRAMLDRATVHHADVVPLLDSEYPACAANANGAGFRAVLAVPLMREGDAYGAIFLWRREPGLFAPDQVALVETFATQAAIAIENVRLFRATQEALEQQTATSEILRVISRLADRRAAGVRNHRGQRAAPLRRPAQRNLQIRRRTHPHRRASAT